MQTTPLTLGSILLGSPDPQRLRDWYQAAFGRAPRDDRFIKYGGAAVLIDGRDDVAPANPEPGRVILNFHVDDARAVAEHLDGMGARWLVPLEPREDNLFGTLIDPDGNLIQIIQLGPEYVARRRAEARRGLPYSGFAVADIPAAARFYRETLGLRVTEEHGMLRLHLDQETSVLVYPKPDHVPARFTILNLPVADIEVAVTDLAGRGVTFLHYDGIAADARGISRGEGPPIAWFTDPAGNIFSVIEEG